MKETETIVYLIRHSVKLDTTHFINNYNSNDKPWIKDEKLILSVDGEKRAEILSNEIELQNLDIVYTSNFVRTLQTAKYIIYKQHIKATIDERLNERREGIITTDTPFNWFCNQYSDANFKLPYGENRTEVQQRMNSIFNEVIQNHQGKRIALFSHFVAISFLLMNWCTIDYKLETSNFYTYKFTFNNKIICNKCINQPEVFKITLSSDNKVSNIELIEFEDLKYTNETVQK